MKSRVATADKTGDQTKANLSTNLRAEPVHTFRMAGDAVVYDRKLAGLEHILVLLLASDWIIAQDAIPSIPFHIKEKGKRLVL